MDLSAIFFLFAKIRKRKVRKVRKGKKEREKGSPTLSRAEEPGILPLDPSNPEAIAFPRFLLAVCLVFSSWNILENLVSFFPFHPTLPSFPPLSWLVPLLCHISDILSFLQA